MLQGIKQVKAINEKDIVKWIQRGKYSNLVFLRDQWSNSEHKWYAGFYYFVQSQKGEDTEAVLNEVISRYGDSSSAYVYLAQTAKKIYNSFDNDHIAVGYCRRAIMLNPNNAEAHWVLYTMSQGASSYIRAVDIEYSSGNFEQVSTWLNHYYLNYNHFTHLSHEEWRTLKSILQNSKVETNNKLQIWTSFNLDEVETCLSLINDAEYVDFEIIKAYYIKGLINKELALDKLYFWQVEKLLEGDDVTIYTEYVKEAQKGKKNPTYTVLIQKAFKAKAYGDIENYFNDAKNLDSFFVHDKTSRLYYLLAQFELGLSLDEEVLDYVRSNVDSLDDESKTLYQVLLFKLNLPKVQSLTTYDFPLEVFAPYQDIKKILNKSEVIKHYLFDALKEEAYQLKVNWYNGYNKKQLDDLKTKLLEADMTEDDFRDLHHFGIECHEYDYVIQSVNDYHQLMPPSMHSYNCIGVCYERKGDLEAAYKYYKLALELMQSLQEYSHVIIGNYLLSAKNLPQIKLSEQESYELRNLFNIELVNQFKWDTFTSRNHSNLFKYTSFSVNTIDSLLNQYFYLAKKEQLNDPIELPNIEGVGDDELIDSNYRLCSLTNNDNSMLMWSHYAQEHQGIMIEYWFGGEFPRGVGVERVSYSDGLKRSKTEMFYAFNQYLLTKNLDWQYEDEVRIFSNQVDKVGFELYDYPNENREMINACISSITLGYKFPHDKRKLISNIVSMINKKRLSHEPLIKLREAYIDEENKFALRYRDLTIS